MSDDKAVILGIVTVCLGLFVVCDYVCETMHRIQQERAKAPTVITCVEHSVLDRITVQH